MKFELKYNNFLLGLIISFLVSCGLTHRKTNTVYIPKVESVPIIQIQHDTIRVKRKALTEAEKKASLNAVYQYGLKNFYEPKFDKLNQSINMLSNTNAKLGESIQGLTSIITSMRERSIKRSDSTNLLMKFYQNELLKVNKEKLASNNTQITTNKKQIDGQNKLIKYLVFACLIMFGLIGLIYLLGYLFYIYIKKELKRIKYA